jgi:lipid II:glycine glycyltransferase (peptidoglycan interpeptide bridge formation enzyme)
MQHLQSNLSDGLEQPPVATAERWKAWDDFLAGTCCAGFMQASAWADFRLTLGYEHLGALIKSKGTIVGGALVQRCWYSSEKCFYYILDGPVLPMDGVVDEDIFNAALEEIDRHRINEQATVSHLRIEPRWEFLPEFVSGFKKSRMN